MGPMAPRGGGSEASDAVQLVWAHNPAALIGALICAALLLAWFHEYFKTPEDADGEV